MFTGEKRKVVSLFSGAGCFDIGFKAAGFQTVLSNDIDRDCCETILLNRTGNVICCPVEDLSSSLIREKTGLKNRELDLLIGGPPCQPYSKSAYGVLGYSDGFEDSRSRTVREYFRIVDELVPKAFVVENVPQFITGDNIRVKHFIERIVRRINKKHGTQYNLNFCKLNAADYGVPQLRERLFIIASRTGQDFNIPSPRFFTNPDWDLEMPPMRTAWDAIGSIRMSSVDKEALTVGGKWGKLLESIPAGSNYLWHTTRGGGKRIFKWRSRYWNFLLKLHPLKPSWTIAASPGQHTGPFHWDGRKLSQLELQLLQTIPDNYLMYGSSTSIRRQIGNGVPSALGELIGKEIRKQFFGDRVSSQHLKLIPQLRPLSNKLKQIFPNARESFGRDNAFL